MSTALSSSSPNQNVEIERGAFNAAFYELGLRWHWDSPTYEALADNPCERSRVRRYLEVEQSHLLRAYEADFLTNAILVTKERRKRAFAGSSADAVAGFDWASAGSGEVGF